VCYANYNINRLYVVNDDYEPKYEPENLVDCVFGEGSSGNGWKTKWLNDAELGQYVAGTKPADSAEVVYEFASALWVNKVDAFGSNETQAKSKSAILYVGTADGDVSSTNPCDDATWEQVGDELFFATEDNAQFNRDNKVTWLPERSGVCWKIKVNGFPSSEEVCGCALASSYETDPCDSQCYKQSQVGLDQIHFENWDWLGIAGPGEQSKSPEKGTDYDKPAYDPANGQRR
jgi:hypothetical protein